MDRLLAMYRNEWIPHCVCLPLFEKSPVPGKYAHNGRTPVLVGSSLSEPWSKPRPRETGPVDRELLKLGVPVWRSVAALIVALSACACRWWSGRWSGIRL